MDTIFIRDLAIRGKHGVEDYERSKEQTFLFDIVMKADISAACRSDMLKDTIDYDPIRVRIVHLVTEQSFHLLETMAQKIIEDIFTDPRITSVVVTIRKPEVYEGATPGISIERSR